MFNIKILYERIKINSLILNSLIIKYMRVNSHIKSILNQSEKYECEKT